MGYPLPKSDPRALALVNVEVGDEVIISPATGVHMGAGVPARVLAVRLDHTHASRAGHTDACYVKAHVEYVLAWKYDVDTGRALLRTNAKAEHCRKVTP